jgi:hypothetical protein
MKPFEIRANVEIVASAVMESDGPRIIDLQIVGIDGISGGLAENIRAKQLFADTCDAFPIACADRCNRTAPVFDMRHQRIGNAKHASEIALRHIVGLPVSFKRMLVHGATYRSRLRRTIQHVAHKKPKLLKVEP